MKLQEYEKQIHEYFASRYLGAAVAFNKKLAGRYSKKEQQVAVLIEDKVADSSIKLVVDTNYFEKEVGVKNVESFITLLEDVGANQGVLVTSKGYSEDALHASYNNPQGLEIDILKFDELLRNQGMMMVRAPGGQKKALWMFAPLGWTVENVQEDDFIACLHQRGMDFPTAQKSGEWICISSWPKDEHLSSIGELIASMDKKAASEEHAPVIDSIQPPTRGDGLKTYIRTAQYDNVPFKEITGFIDSPEFIVSFMLLTLKELESRNIERLMQVLHYSYAVELNFDHTKNIAALEANLPELKKRKDRVAAYEQLARWYAEMDELETSMRYRRMCWDIAPDCYSNIPPMIAGELFLENSNVAMRRSEEFFAQSPHNPKVMQDLIELYAASNDWESFEKVIVSLKDQYSEDKEALGNIHFHHAMHLGSSGQHEESSEKFKLARMFFVEIDKHHDVIELIDGVLAGSEGADLKVVH